MNLGPHVFVTGMGVVCAGAHNVPELRSLLATPQPNFRPPTVFPCQGEAATLPAAEITGLDSAEVGCVPRTLPFSHPPIPLPQRRLLLLDIGPHATAIEVFA